MKAKNILNLFLICGCQLFSGLSFYLLSPFYPKEALSKGVTVTESGFVFASVYITGLIFTPLCGKYQDRLGGAKIFLVVGSFICGLANAGFGFLYLIQDKTIFLTMSFIVRIIVALGESAISSSAYCMAIHQVEKKHEGKAMSMAEACYGVGMFIGPFIGGVLYEAAGFGLPFWLSGGILVVFGLALFILMQVAVEESDGKEYENVGWWTLLTVSGIPISIFSLCFSGSSWAWYTASLEPYLETTYGTTVSQTGLLFTIYGITYTVFTPLSGILMDRGMSGLLIQFLGNLLVTLGYLFLGPIPPLHSIASVWLTGVSLGVQGMGCAATYLGALVYMTQCTEKAGLPKSDQVTGMVTSLWVTADCVGSFLGSTLGSVAYDKIGFEWGSLVEAMVIGSTVILIGGCMLRNWHSQGGRNKNLELKSNNMS